MSSAIPQLVRCALHQKGPGVIVGPLCHYCHASAATEMANGEHACWPCAHEIAVERLMQKYHVSDR